MIMPESFTYDGVIAAMERGDMYASMGPVIHEVSVDGNHLCVRCSPAAHIYMYDGGKNPKRIHAVDGGMLTQAEFEIGERARYIRISVRDAQGRWADTRGYSREEIGLDVTKEI